MLAILLLPLLSAVPQEPVEETNMEGIWGERWTPEARVYALAGPSVVSVDVFERPAATPILNPSDVLAPLKTPISQGTGVVIDPEGFVITNAHVVHHPEIGLAERDLLVVLSFADNLDSKGAPGDKVFAKVLNIDAEWDLALLKIEKVGPYPAIHPAESALLIGEKVIAIGTALGNAHSVTSGILSGVHRDVRVRDLDGQGFHQLNGLLQTDAAINPGNSGGPLLNIYGELIGINSATLEAADGISYAIPVDRVSEILRTRLYEPRVWMGMRLRRGSDPIVQALHPRGPAQRSGLMVGDRIVAVDGQAVLNAVEFAEEMFVHEAGDLVVLDVEREDRRMVVELRLASVDQRDSFGLLGFLCERDKLWISDGNSPSSLYSVLRITGVFQDTGAERLGLEPGDMIVAVHLLGDREGDGWTSVTSQKQLVRLIQGPDFNFDGLNLWWVKKDATTSMKGRLTFDSPALAARQNSTQGL